ncbi:MAG: MmgE/PrpD family protein [Alphaproteobacteria bacterium]|nr:MmgE/PrpD family protein [Alphaproteobacteria bacterium]
MTGNITGQLAEFSAGLRLESIDAAITERAKLLLLDTIGIAVRARHDAESTPALLRAAQRLGFMSGTATIIGDAATANFAGAAWINGALAHSLDFDDTHAAGSIHPSAPIVPAALAAAEMAGASGRDTLAGIIAGYEVQIRLSLALVPSDHYARGFHPTATCGAFGAAAAAGRVLGLNAGQIAHGFGICLSQTSGTMEFLADGAWTKRFQAGYAAMNGLIAASLAAEGFIGPLSPIEGAHGFLNSYAPHPVFEKACAGLGERYETMAIAIKPYPSCRYSHAAMDGLIALRAQHGFSIDEIESVEVGLPKTGWDIIGAPQEAKQNPKSIVDGQFSMPFLAAVALRQGGMGWDDYARHLHDPETLALTRRVTSVADPQAEAEYPRQMSGVARVRTRRGNFEKFVAIPKGEPENFPDLPELRQKFDALAGPYMPQSALERLAGTLTGLDRANTVTAMLALTRPN